MSKDPLGHIRLAVSDLTRSIDFYDRVLGMLGCERVAEKGWTTSEGFGIWLIQAAHVEPHYTFEAPGLHHLCFKAKSVAGVDSAYHFLASAGVRILDEPKHYPQYTNEYYAVFFADPDGMKLEIAYY